MFGFLYNGYKKEYYFWEIVIMYRKIAIIFIAVFIANYGLAAQALSCLLLLVAFLMMSMKKKPFNTEALNDLETLSLITQTISVYCGLFFVSDIP